MRRPRFLLAIPAWAWLVTFFVLPVATVVYFSFGYKPGLFGTHATDVLSLDRYREALSPTFFTTFTNTLRVGILGTLICLLIAIPMLVIVGMIGDIEEIAAVERHLDLLAGNGCKVMVYGEVADSIQGERGVRRPPNLRRHVLPQVLSVR